MGVRVRESSPARVRLEAPLAPNVNHRETAFGGSVAALAILAGWTLIHLRLRAEGIEARTVIQSSQVDYGAPIDGAFFADASAPDPAVWARFTNTLRRRARARIGLDVVVHHEGTEAATFRGAYVALTQARRA